MIKPWAVGAFIAMLCCASSWHSAEAAGGLRAEKDAGYLDIASDPRAKIIIDDVDTGKVTPESQLEVKPGRHKLTLVTLDGAHQRTLGFSVEAGQTRKFTVHLAR